MLRKPAALAAMLLCVLVLGGCAAGATQAPSPSPSTSAAPAVSPSAQITMAATIKPTATPEATETPAPTPSPMQVTIEGKNLTKKAIKSDQKVMLPLLETMDALGYKATVSELEENESRRKVHTFKKDKIEIAVSYLLKDNTVSDISFARDKMIVPVDRLLLFEAETVFAPANFFEEAAGVTITQTGAQVVVSTGQIDVSPTTSPKPTTKP